MNKYYIDFRGVKAEVPSVTEVIGQIRNVVLEKWKIKQAIETGIDPSGKTIEIDIGRAVHSMIEYDLLGKDINLDGYDDYVINTSKRVFEKWILFKKNHDIKLLFTEKELTYGTDDGIGFGGRPDIVADINGRVTLIDIKTSKQIYDEYIIQLSAYRYLLISQGEVIDRVMVLRLGKGGDDDYDFHEIDRALLEHSFKYFWSLVKLFYDRKNIKNLIKMRKRK